MTGLWRDLATSAEGAKPEDRSNLSGKRTEEGNDSPGLAGEFSPSLSSEAGHNRQASFSFVPGKQLYNLDAQ